MATKSSIAELTRRQILYYLEEAATGDELLLKEVWEDCETTEDFEEVTKEVERIIAILEAA